MELVIDRGVKSYDVKDADGTLLGVIKINPADIGISGRFVSARNAIAELAEQAKEVGIEISHVASATGSGGTTAGLVLGTSLFLPQAKATGLGVDTDPFEEIVSELVKEAAGLVGQPVPTDMDSRFRMIYHVGAGYAIPNAEDTPYIEELARQEGILLDPVYTGKAWAKFLMLVKEGYFDGQEHIAFVHTGGAAALFAMDLG